MKNARSDSNSGSQSNEGKQSRSLSPDLSSSDSTAPRNEEEYRQDLLSIREAAFNLLRQMRIFDFKYEGDMTKMLTEVNTLKHEINRMCIENLVDENQELWGDLEFSVEKVKDLNVGGLIGGEDTAIGLKGEDSFLIGTDCKGIVLVENGIQLYSGVIEGYLSEIVYVSPLNSYLFAHFDEIYRKDVDSKPPYLFLDIDCGGKLRYSQLLKRLIINKESNQICLLNPKTKKIEIELKNKEGGSIKDFKLFGEHENRIIAVTSNKVKLYNLTNSDQKKEIFDSYLDLGYNEEPTSLSICNKNKYMVITFEKHERCSGLQVYKIFEDSLINTAYMTYPDLSSGTIQALGCFGYAEARILWVGLSMGEAGDSMIFDYDTETGEFRELEEKRVSHGEYGPTKLHSCDSKCYYVGRSGSLMKLSLRC